MIIVCSGGEGWGGSGVEAKFSIRCIGVWITFFSETKSGVDHDFLFEISCASLDDNSGDC